MIRIEISDEALLAAIEKAKPGWLRRARDRRDAVLAAGRIAESDAIWSEIKEVFILLQAHKCIYCERPMPKTDSESADKVAVDYDMEHYRPKSRVTAWPTQETIQRRPGVGSYQGSVRAGSAEGYLRLAFEPSNYMVACKVCNSSYKADRFPIAGTPDTISTDIAALDSIERPLLLFPFGERGVEPRAYFRFLGTMVYPRALRTTARTRRAVGAYKQLQAQVTVDFFELDTREDLIELRCYLIQALWPQLENLSSLDEVERTLARDFVRAVRLQQRFPQMAWGRAFIALYRKDRGAARTWYQAAAQYLSTKEPNVFGPRAAPPRRR